MILMGMIFSSALVYGGYLSFAILFELGKLVS